MMFSSYLVVSLIAFAADWAFFVMLSTVAPIDIGVAAWTAYLLGGVINYVLLRRFVFHSDAVGSRRTGEALLFAASCGLGALLTGGIVHVSAPIVGKVVAKAAAVADSFVTLYWIRRIVIFHTRRPSSVPAPAAARRTV